MMKISRNFANCIERFYIDSRTLKKAHGGTPFAFLVHNTLVKNGKILNPIEEKDEDLYEITVQNNESHSDMDR